jgi:hypothetical protein
MIPEPHDPRKNKHRKIIHTRIIVCHRNEKEWYSALLFLSAATFLRILQSAFFLASLSPFGLLCSRSSNAFGESATTLKVIFRFELAPTDADSDPSDQIHTHTRHF